MSWNHRVVKVKDFIAENGYSFIIKEVYYDEELKPIMRTLDSARVCGESVEELKEVLQWMLNCLDKPILDDENDFPDCVSNIDLEDSENENEISSEDGDKIENG